MKAIALMGGQQSVMLLYWPIRPGRFSLVLYISLGFRYGFVRKRMVYPDLSRSAIQVD